MKYYLVDYENVGAAGLSGLDRLGEDSRVFTFYTKNADKMPISLHKLIAAAAIKPEFVEVMAGTKNSLDFQLVSYLGYLIAQNEGSEFFIVSKDEGFASTAAFWQNNGAGVALVYNLLGECAKAVDAEIAKLLPEYENDVPQISALVKKYRTKQGINNALVKEFGNEKGGRIYKTIKPLLKDKNH